MANFVKRKTNEKKNGDEEKVDTLGESKSNGKLNQQTVYKKLLLEILITKVPALLPDHSKLMADNSILSLCHVVSVCACIALPPTCSKVKRPNNSSSNYNMTEQTNKIEMNLEKACTQPFTIFFVFLQHVCRSSSIC